ncbi:MAG TPA: hypothetical protein EYQ83_03075 [Acidobacteria bacterium]|nr:hypothetical protein [Acidobacteriota bacterium]
MKLPRVNPVGLVEHPDDYAVTARVYSRGLRIGAAIVLGTFVTVSLTTTIISLGAYCLTSGTGPIGLLF